MPRHGRQEDQELRERMELVRKWCDLLWDGALPGDVDYVMDAVGGAGFPQVANIGAMFLADMIAYGTRCVLDLILDESEQGDTDFLASDYLAGEWLDYRWAERGSEIMSPALRDHRPDGVKAPWDVRTALVFAAMQGGLRMVRRSYDGGLTIADMLSIVVLGDG